MEDAEGARRAAAGSVEPVPARRPPRRRAHEPRVRAAGRDHGPRADRRRGVQLLGARHRQHGGAARLRHARAAGALAAAAAGRRDPLGLRDDRARRGQLGRHQHRDADRARGRRVRAQRAQVVDDRGAAPELPRPDRDGQDEPEAPTYQQQSMVLVPLDTPGVTVERSTTVFGYTEPEGHGVVRFEDVRVPAENIIAGEGHGLRDRPGAARPGPHPPLHARRSAPPSGRWRCCAPAPTRARRSATRSPPTPTCATGSPSRGSRSRWRACS